MMTLGIHSLKAEDMAGRGGKAPVCDPNSKMVLFARMQGWSG